MLQQMLASFLLLAIFISCGHTAQVPKLTVSSNVTTGKINEPFTLRCEVEDKRREGKSYTLEFWYDTNGQLAVFDFYVALSKDDTAFTFRANFNHKNQQFISQVVPLPYKNNSVYEISITPKTNFTTSFYCAKSIDAISHRSNYLNVAVVDPKAAVKPHQNVKIIATTNATRIKAGHPFSMRCDLNSDFKFGTDHYQLMFVYSINGMLGQFDFPASKSGQLKVANWGTYLMEKDRLYIEQISPIRHSLTSFEALITPSQLAANFSADWFCALYQGDQPGLDSRAWTRVKLADSNYIPISVVSPPPPQLNLTSNSSGSYHLGEPFTLSCSISSFEAKGKQYSVQYYSSRDGLIAAYDVDASGKSFLSAGVYDKFSAHLGARSTFPTFDLAITENVDQKLGYWCQLAVANKQFKSAVWKPTGPFLSFTSSTNKNSDHLGTCTIERFEEHTKVDYQVSFHSNLGDKADNLLAYFLLKPNKTTEFVHGLHLSSWSSIATNATKNVSYPSFEIVGRISGNLKGNNTWWCLLTIGSSGQAHYRVIKSNVQKIV